MRIALGCDHRGFPVKGAVRDFLERRGHDVVICGSHDSAPVDFPDIAAELCAVVTSGDAERGILVCSTGVGAVMAANKVSGIRATLCGDTYSAHQAVEHDDANVLCLGADVIGLFVLEEIIESYLAAKFDDSEEFRRRVAKLNAMDSPRAGS